jgi:hypothetical protein
MGGPAEVQESTELALSRRRRRRHRLLEQVRAPSLSSSRS